MSINGVKGPEKKKRGVELKSWIYNGKKLQKTFKQSLKKSNLRGVNTDEIVAILGKIKNNTVLEKAEEDLLNRVCKSSIFIEEYANDNPNIPFAQLQYHLQTLITNNKLIEALDSIESDEAFSFEHNGKKFYFRVIEKMGDIEVVENLKTGASAVIQSRNTLLLQFKHAFSSDYIDISSQYMILTHGKGQKHTICSLEGDHITIKGRVEIYKFGDETYILDRKNNQFFRLNTQTGIFEETISEGKKIYQVLGDYIVFIDVVDNAKQSADLYSLELGKNIIPNISTKKDLFEYDKRESYEKLFFVSEDEKTFFILDKTNGNIQKQQMRSDILEDAIHDYYFPYEEYDYLES